MTVQPQRGRVRRGAGAAAARLGRAMTPLDRTRNVVAVLLACALGSAVAGYSSLFRLNLAEPTIDVRVPPVVAPRPVTPAGRVLLVVLDGLGAAPAAALPALARLAERGAWVELAAEPPTFSSAQYVAFLSGVGPLDSGVRTNLNPRWTPLDTVVRAVRARGGRAVEVGDQVDWWRLLFAWDEALVVAPDRLLDEAVPLLAGERNELVLVHATGPDQAGHAAGAASARYREATDAAARLVEALAARWGDQGTLVVLSDHGHRPRGGHGGSEPDVRRAFMLLAGPGIRPGARVAQASTPDVAPTLAALLGVVAPAQALGRTLVEVLSVSDADRQALVAADQERARLVQRLAADGRAALAKVERRARMIRLAVMLLVLAGTQWIVRRLGPPAWRGIAYGAAAAALACLLLFIVGGRPSFSAFPHLRELGIATGLVALTAGLLSLALPARAVLSGRLSSPQAARLAIGVGLGAAPLAATAFLLAGIFAPRFTCRPDWLAASPVMLYLAFAPILACAAALALLACLRTR